jgi:hypothetical protein
MEMNYKYRWISWYQPGPDYRPITFPPHDSIMGWWCSGEDMQGNFTLVAHVRAGSMAAARRIIKDKGCWPEAKKWRFCVPTDHNEPAGGRFIPSDWMISRYEDATDAERARTT